MTSPLKGMMKGRQRWGMMNELEFHGGSAGLEVPSANAGHASATKFNNTLGCIWTEMIHDQRNQDPKETVSRRRKGKLGRQTGYNGSAKDTCYIEQEGNGKIRASWILTALHKKILVKIRASWMSMSLHKMNSMVRRESLEGWSPNQMIHIEKKVVIWRSLVMS